MRDAAADAVEQWYLKHARGLRAIDGRLEALALKLTAKEGRPVFPSEKASTSPNRPGLAWLRASASVGSRAAAGMREAARHTVPDSWRGGARRVAARLASELGERAGIHDRIRAAGRRELETVWVGIMASPDGTRPLLSQLLDIIDETAIEAREMIT
jgi:hypothetical protein